jgi:hypothetical protein
VSILPYRIGLVSIEKLTPDGVKQHQAILDAAGIPRYRCKMKLPNFRRIGEAVIAALAGFMGNKEAIRESFEDSSSLDQYGLISVYDNTISQGPTSIVVSTEFDKQQVLAFSRYLHDLREIDTSLAMVNFFAHVHLNPDLVLVRRTGDG